MSIRIFKFGIITTVIQLMLYWTIFMSIHKISLLLTHGETAFISDGAFGYSLGIFAMLLLVQNIFTAILDRKRVYVNSAYITSCLIILAWCEDLDSWPYQSVCFMIISVITIFSKFYIDKILARYLLE